MKIKTFIAASFLIPGLCFAELEAKPFKSLLQTIARSQFKAKGRGLIFGYNSIQSCLFVSKDIAIFKNYCFPKKEYPAQGYTIISSDFGVVDLYEEDIEGIKERDISISHFKDQLLPYLTTPLPTQNVSGLSEILEKLYNEPHAGCWSTSYGDYTSGPDARCNVDSSTILGANEWFDETQKIVNDEEVWSRLLESLEALTTQP